MLSHVDGTGGRSTFVDGFRAAYDFHKEHRPEYSTLSVEAIPAHASGDEGLEIRPWCHFPVFNHHPQTGMLGQIRWNLEDRAIKSRWTSMDSITAWYRAASMWKAWLRKPKYELQVNLEPGTPVSKSPRQVRRERHQAKREWLMRLLVFDNWRFLHGRTAFTGKRRMCGGYSKLRILSAGKIMLIRTFSQR